MQIKNYHTGRRMAKLQTQFIIKNTLNSIEEIPKPFRIILALTVRDEINYGRHIFMQLEDAIKLDYDEIVILDDGSSDGTWDVLKEFATKYNNIHIKRNEINSIISKGENRWFTLIKECAKYHPTWIHFRACDQLHSHEFNINLRNIVKYFHENGAWLVKFPLVHLWRSEGWFRHDNIWLNDYLNHSRRQLWRFYKDYEYNSDRLKAAFHLGGHLPDKYAPHNLVKVYNVNSFFRQPRKDGHWRVVVLHYGHTTHSKKEIKFRLTMQAARNGISYGCPPPEYMPHPRHWLQFNGYKGFYEFPVYLKKVPAFWFNNKELDYSPPKVMSFYKVISEYRKDRAEEYQQLFDQYKNKIPIIV